LITLTKPSPTSMSGGTPWKRLSERSITNRGGSAIEKVVKLGGRLPWITTAILVPSSFTETDVISLSFTCAWTAPAASERARMETRRARMDRLRR
jgi:hypothetical protein